MLFSLGQAVAQVDARNQPTANKPQRKDPGLAKFALFKKTSPRPKTVSPVNTNLPLKLQPGMSIAFVGNTLLDRSQDFGYL